MSPELPFLPRRSQEPLREEHPSPKRRGLPANPPSTNSIPEHLNPKSLSSNEELNRNTQAGIPPKRRGIRKNGPSNDPPIKEPNPSELEEMAAINKIYQSKALPALPQRLPNNPLPFLPESIPFLPGPSQPASLSPTSSNDRPLPPLPIQNESLPDVDVLGYFHSEEHFAVFNEIFGLRDVNGKVSNPEEVRVIYQRMVKFAHASGATADAMVMNVKLGREVASEIASEQFGSNTAEYSAKDLVAFDWFLRSQQAKLNQLYLKGTLKFPDPDHHFAQFLLQVRGQNRGKEAIEKGPYPRPSSHLPEERSEIKKNTIHCQNGEKICFSKSARDSLYTKRDVQIDKVHYFNNNALGIDASGMNLSVPGKGSETYLFHLFYDLDVISQTKVPMVIVKNESNSFAPIDKNKTWGNRSDLAKDKVKHGFKLYKKFVPSNSKKLFASLKEDKLPPKICSLLEDVEIFKCEKGLPITQSYERLKESTRMGNDCNLLLLKTHLNYQLEAEILLAPQQKEKIIAVLQEIENHFQKAIEMQENGDHLFLPRGQESILPAIPEMLKNKVKFIPS